MRAVKVAETAYIGAGERRDEERERKEEERSSYERDEESRGISMRRLSRRHPPSTTGAFPHLLPNPEPPGLDR